MRALRPYLRLASRHFSSDPYQILGLQPGASPEDVRRAYLRAAIRTHPDSNECKAAEAFRQVAEAYQRLRNKKVSRSLGGREANGRPPYSAVSQQQAEELFQAAFSGRGVDEMLREELERCHVKPGAKLRTYLKHPETSFANKTIYLLDLVRPLCLLLLHDLAPVEDCLYISRRRVHLASLFRSSRGGAERRHLRPAAARGPSRLAASSSQRALCDEGRGLATAGGAAGERGDWWYKTFASLGLLCLFSIAFNCFQMLFPIYIY